MVLAVVVPFLDEEEHLPELLASVHAQDRPPDHLLLVDDGSGDRSPELARGFAERHPYARALTRPRRPRGADRLAAAGELRAFQWAVEQLPPGWDVVAKLDADLRLPPTAFAELLQHFERDRRLGLAGTFLTQEAPGGALGRIRIGDGHVHGATKFYRRACFEDIAPIPAILGWDTIDELRAQRAGWTTRSFALAAGDPIHLRPRGTHDGPLRARRRFGRAAYAFGEPGLLVALEALRSLRQPPRVLGGAAYAAGWAVAALRREARAEPELLAWVRAVRYRRLRARLRTRVGTRLLRELRLARWRRRNRAFAPRLRHDPAAPALILSPHLDDAVLDCWSVLDGGAAANAATIFAGVPRSPDADRWDRIAGARDAVALGRTRLAEDRDALALAGARPLHLPFVDAAHRGSAPPPTFAALDAELAAHVAAASVVLAPAVLGTPHEDHVVVRDFALALHAAGLPVRLYADLPYAVVYGWPPWVTGTPDDPHLDVDAYWRQGGTDPELVAREHADVVRLAPEAAARKLEAIRRYRTQFATLDRGPVGLLRDPAVHGTEVFWTVG
jgi:glycosyltransferase involved in cell wall biosynthesis